MFFSKHNMHAKFILHLFQIIDRYQNFIVQFSREQHCIDLLTFQFFSSLDISSTNFKKGLERLGNPEKIEKIISHKF